MFLKVYFWIYLLISALGYYIIFAEDASRLNLGDYLDMGIALMGLVGLYIYAFKKNPIKEARFWSFILVCNIISVFFVIQRNITSNPAGAASVIFELPILYALYKLSAEKRPSKQN